MGLTLVDIFIQLVFLLLSLLFFYYVENLDSEKWEAFVRDGTSIFGGTFAETWYQFPASVGAKVDPPVAPPPEVKPASPPQDTARAPGREACLPEKGKSITYSGKFQYTAGGIKFLGFTPAFEEYIQSKRPDLREQTTRLSQRGGTVFSPQELIHVFGPIRALTCQHFFISDESLLEDWMNGPDAVKFYKRMKSAIVAIK